MSEKGRASVLDGPEGKFSIEEYDLPKVGDGEVLVKVDLCGVCGTDAHVYHGRLFFASYPLVLGHEPMGTIVGLGPGIETDTLGRPVKGGDRVYVGYAPCGKCYFCAVLKKPNLCPNTSGIGLGGAPPGKDWRVRGGYSEYIHVSNGVPFFRVDTEPHTGVLLEPLVIAYHQVERAGAMLGDTVGVQGAGAIGIFAAALAKHAGAPKVIVIGAPEARLEKAREFGADTTINIESVTDPAERVKAVTTETRHGYGADVVFECTGVPAALAEGLSMLRVAGTYVAAGHFTDAGDVALNPFRHFTSKHVNLVGVWGADLSHWAGALPLIEAGTYPFAEVISHELPLERVPDAIQSLSTNYRLAGKEVGKIVIAP